MDANEAEDRLTFLLSASRNAIPKTNFNLQSYFNIHMARFADRHILNLPKTYTNRNLICPYCCVPWRQDTTTFELIPSKKLKKHERRKDKNINRNQIERRNKLILKCKVCSKSSPFSLVKKNKNLAIEKKKEKEIEKAVRKKKKKKDKSCGLKSKYVTPLSNKMPNNNSLNQKTEHNSSPNPKDVKSSQTSNKPQKSSIQKTEPCKKLINPFAPQVQNSISKKSKKKLKQLRQVLKEDKTKDSIKNSIKDFLNLVSI